MIIIIGLDVFFFFMNGEKILVKAGLFLIYVYLSANWSRKSHFERFKETSPACQILRGVCLFISAENMDSIPEATWSWTALNSGSVESLVTQGLEQ